MLKGGSLPSPIITPLSSSPLSSKNKIHTQTFVEIRSDIPNIRIYFTVDGTKPDPFQTFRTGSISTYLYRGAFRLGPGRRVVKAIAVTQNGLRESNIITKFLDVNDKYSENYDESLNEYSDNDQSLADQYQSNQCKNDLDRCKWEDDFHLQGNIEGPIWPLNYAGTQVDHLCTPEQDWIEPNRNSQYDYMREQMVERLPPPPPPPILPPPKRVMDVTYEEENFWDRKIKPLSPGNGNWKKTLDHIFLNVYNYVKDERELREIFGWKTFGRIETIRLVDKGSTYQVLATFKKPLGQQTPYEEPPLLLSVPNRKRSSKHRSKKRTRTPPDVEDERPSRHNHSLKLQDTDEEKSTQHNRSLRQPDTDEEKSIQCNHSFKPPIRHEESIHEEEEQTPRIYTEEIVQQGTLISYPHFNVQQDCENLRKSMKGLGTDEDMLIHILGNRSHDQRVNIRDTYKNMFGKDLERDVKGDTSGNFCKLLRSLLYDPVEYDCHELYRAIKGLGTNEEALIEILASRSNKRLRDINNLYPKLFKQSLEENIVNDTSGYFKKLLVALVQDQRPESNRINEKEVKKDAKELYDSGENKWGTDESKFIQILCNRSDAQLKAIFEAYHQFSKRDIEADIKSETSGSLRNGLLAIVGVMRNRPGFFVSQLKKALKGAGTNEDELNRVIISRCEVDMIQIKEEYENTTKRSLEDHVQSDTSGDYRKLLLELLKSPNQRTQKPGKKKYEDVNLSDSEQPEIYDEEIIQQGTMTAAKNFDAIRDADALRKAMKGAGTDEKTIISILGNRDTNQRLEIKAAFKNKHNRDLVADLKSETSGNFSKLLEKLLLDPVELDCSELKQAVKGVGTNEEAIIEILANRSNKRIRSINETYSKMFGKTLEKDVKSDTSGDFRRLLVSLMQGHRPETTKVNADRVKRDAQSLIDASSDKFGTDEAKFNELFCNRSDSELKAIFNQFAELSGKSIEEIVKKETSGDIQKGILAIIRCIRSRPHFFAEQLQKAMKGSGSKESTLNRIIITRSEIDLVQIKVAYKHLYNCELERDISADTSGEYKKLLLEIFKDPSQRN
ncbi:unnamed protein product [Rotaria magnacalcarata]|uniref:Annexin n=1 Tax=Rotaria magnacalcarata TaxID=392030 RepID=A0A814VIZ4_9BILA|nr:unnamed protein product [Rotaria magnacalcarata]